MAYLLDANVFIAGLRREQAGRHCIASYAATPTRRARRWWSVGAMECWAPPVPNPIIPTLHHSQRSTMAYALLRRGHGPRSRLSS